MSKKPGSLGDNLPDGSDPSDAAAITPSTVLGWFPRFVDALVHHPNPSLPITVGENGTSGATSTIFWEYNNATGLHLESTAGYLTTASGNGGFTMDVGTDGSWVLRFGGSGKVIFWNAATQTGSGPNLTAPPAGNTLDYPLHDGSNVINETIGHVTFDGRGAPGAPVASYDTVQGGVGDYMIGGTAPHLETPTGNVGDCAIYTLSAGPVLVDMQNDNGYGGNAEGNSYVDMNQVRGSLNSNVLIGNANGTDLKSGGANSVLISTGGNGFELRPDGTNNTLVSTVGADRVLFDPSHGWALGDTATLLGFNPAHGVTIDLSLIGSTFHTPGADSNLADYVQLIDTASGEKVMFNGSGNVGSAGVDVLDLALVHGYSAQSLYDSHNLTI